MTIAHRKGDRVSRFRNLRVFAGVVLAAGALALADPAAAQRRGGGDRAALVAVDAVVSEPLRQTLPVIGRLVARRAGVVAARTHGPVKHVLVEVGDRVEAGQRVAVLEDDRLRSERDLRAAEVAEERAKIATAEAAVALARQELRRLEDLRKSAAFPQARYEDKQQDLIRSESQVTEARARLARAEASFRMADIDVKYATIRAPYPGVISKRHTVPGAYVSVGDPVVTLINDLDLEIEADVPFERVQTLESGTVVAFTLGREAQHLAIVRAVVPEENPLTRTRVVRFTPDFKNGGTFATNQSVTLMIPVGSGREMVTVHKDAVVRSPGGAVVFVVENGAAKRRRVELGDPTGSRLVVRAGLKPGDRAVVRGNERLSPDQKVRVEKQR
jgi:RND family efflux transporter MFP subunit